MNMPLIIIKFLRIEYLKLLPTLTSLCNEFDVNIPWVHTVNFCLIIKICPPFKNPGPNFKNELTFYYQNVQGLIPFGQLAKEHPVFNDAKLIQLHHYVESRTPDIVVLNETWLKKSINDSEILPSNLYTIFRRDRCSESHSIDKDNPKKFRRNGGGVLIAISNALAATSKIIPLKCRAEILGIEILLENKTKFIIATCYRVGTLGMDNAEEILRGVRTLTRKKNVKNVILVGDLQSPAYKLVRWYRSINNRQHVLKWLRGVRYGTMHRKFNT